MNSSSPLNPMNRNKPIVSVVIPTFNRAGFLKRAVESVLRQQYDPLEVVIVDDGSTDDTCRAARELQEKTEGILFLDNNRKKGPSGARNTGILGSSGDFIAFLDSDDAWLENHLPLAASTLLQHSDIDVFFGNSQIVNDVTGRFLGNFFDKKTVLHGLQTEQMGVKVRRITEDLFIPLVRENFFHLGSSLVRRKQAEDALLDEDVMFAEDRDFAIRLCRRGKATFAYTTDPVAILSKHEANLNSDNIQSNRSRTEAQILLFRRYLSAYQLSGAERALLCRTISRLLVDLAYLHRDKHEYWTAFRRLVDSTRYGLFPKQAEELAKIGYCSVLRP